MHLQVAEAIQCRGMQHRLTDSIQVTILPTKYVNEHVSQHLLLYSNCLDVVFIIFHPLVSQDIIHGEVVKGLMSHMSVMHLSRMLYAIIMLH